MTARMIKASMRCAGFMFATRLSTYNNHFWSVFFMNDISSVWFEVAFFVSVSDFLSPFFFLSLPSLEYIMVKANVY